MAEYRFPLRGEADLAAAPGILADLDRAIADSDAECFLVDCSDLTFIDSTGVRALYAAYELLVSQRRTMTMVNLASGPRRVFEILGLTATFNIGGLISS